LLLFYYRAEEEDTVAPSVLNMGDKVHIITRRLFPDDIRRHFAGEVLEASGDQVRVEGYVFVYNQATNEYERRPDKRIRIFSLSGAGVIVIVLPKTVDLDALHYVFVNQRLKCTDGKEFSMDINEFGANA
jgi:hypothetical protein